MAYFEPSVISLTSDEIKDLIDTLDARKFEERMRASRLRERQNHEGQHQEQRSANVLINHPTIRRGTGIGIQPDDQPLIRPEINTDFSRNQSLEQQNSSTGIPSILNQLGDDQPADVSEDYNMLISHGSGEYTNNTDNQSFPSAFDEQNSNIIAGDRIISASSNIASERNDERNHSEISSTEANPNPFFPVDN